MMLRLLKPIWFISLCLVVVLSVLPGSPIPHIGHLDKLHHFSAYAWLAFLQASCLKTTRSKILLAAFLLLLGGLLELVQAVVPNRDSSLGDLAANTAGVIIGTAIGTWGAFHFRDSKE
ncbi:VanZ family protein [Pseudodesulfovibrio sediminis]|uniref:VanZ family protein n=1 Tax=Pseudodesulfovibrio sediminis TaxID=2810563 RepID=UPI001E5B46F8|nr:VanZ family protein [Pseudodesulfovibrio sediminis]